MWPSMDWWSTPAFCVTLLLVSARLAGLFVLAPVFGERVVPRRVAVLLAVAMALPLAARVDVASGVAWSWPGLAMAVAGEATVGLALGYVARLMFVGVEIGAFHVSQQMGLSLAEVYGGQERADPTRPMLHLLAVVIFLAVGGHRFMLSAVVRSFDTLPPLALTKPGVLDVVTGLLGASFVLALKVAAPVLLAMLLAGVLLGLLQRTAPTLSILSVGLPVRVLLGLVLLASMLALGTLPRLLEWASRQVGVWIEAVAKS